MNYKMMVKALMLKLGYKRVSEILLVGHSILYYWAEGKRKPKYWTAKAIEELYNNEIVIKGGHKYDRGSV